MELIDKEILLLKIDSKIEEAQKVFNVAPSSVIGGMIEGYTRTKKIISSLEVKEVDLEKEPHYPKSKEASGTLKKMLDNITEESLEKARKQLQEELVSDVLNTESMIESYKQRLISQTNGMKNSPLIDMCLASYKHGINETLDTLNLSNVERTLKLNK